MDNVFVVTSGSYSDYRIETIFDNKRAAEEYIKLHCKYDRHCDFNDIEEYELNSVTPNIKPIYKVELDLNGNIRNQYTTATKNDSPIEWVDIWTDTIIGESDRNYDVALKIARDKLAMIKAEKEGLT